MIPMFERCDLCYSYANTGKLKGPAGEREHLHLAWCVAALAARLGKESHDDAVLRMIGPPVPATEVAFFDQELEPTS